MIKHWTSSVFVYGNIGGEYRIVLLKHKRLHRWMIPGGHIESHEDPVEAAHREVFEETGLLITLVAVRLDALIDTLELPSRLAAPAIILAETIPAYNRSPPHIHIDCLYFATTRTTKLTPSEGESEHVGWFAANELGRLPMFDETRQLALAGFSRIPHVWGAVEEAAIK